MANDDGPPRDLLKQLNNDERGEISLAVGVWRNKVRVDLGKKVDWFALDAAHIDAFITALKHYREELR